MGTQAPILCGDWEGRRVSQTHRLFTLCDSRHRIAPLWPSFLPRDTGQPVPLVGLWHHGQQEEKSQTPGWLTVRLSLSALEPHRGPRLSEPLPHGGVARGAGPLSRGSFVLWKLLAHGGQRSLLAPAPGPAGCQKAHPTQPQPPSIPGYWHTPASTHRGPGPRGSTSALCLPPWTGPSGSPGLHLLVCDKRAAMWGSPPRISPDQRLCRESAHPPLTLHVISRPQTATLAPAASRLTAG